MGDPPLRGASTDSLPPSSYLTRLPIKREYAAALGLFYLRVESLNPTLTLNPLLARGRL